MLDTVLSFACDLDRGIDRTLIRPALLTGDKQAHTFRLAVTRSGVNADIAGAGVSAYFVRADGVTVPITGSVEGSAALVTLPDGCYRVPGRFQIVVKLSTGSGISTVFWGDGAVASSSTDVMLDTEDVIPSLDELLAQIAATEAAAEHANSAAASANTAASGANSAASSASTAASRANAAAASIESIGAEATTLAPGSAATATWSTVDGTKVLTIGVPQGIQGEKGEKGDKGDKGDPGADGSGSVSSVNGVAPVQGNVTLAASDVGALPEDGTAADAGMLGGKAPAYYLQPRNLLDNSDFRNPVNQRGASSYSSNVYTIDRWALWWDGITNGTLSIDDDGITATQYLYQNLDIDQDKDYTFAVSTANGLRIVSGTPYNTVTDGVITIKTNNEYVQVNIYNGGKLYWAALYEGVYTADTLPPYVPKGYGAELTECRRYYRRNEFLNCAKTSGNYFSVSASIEMRVVPTAELLTFAPYGSSTITDMSGGSIAIAQTTAGVQRITYANLPTCAAHSAGGLAVNLSADL